MKLFLVKNCLLPHLNTPKNLLTEKKELFFYKEILNLFLPIFNKLNYKFEKKNPFFLPESRSRNPQVACPKKHFFNDGLGYKSSVNE